MKPGIGIQQMRNIQGPSHTVQNEYQRLQDEIFRKEGVECTVVVTPHHVSIKTETYADFLLAKRAIKGSQSLPIERAI